MNRRTLARRYAPLLAVVAIQLLIIAAVPSKAPKTVEAATAPAASEGSDLSGSDFSGGGSEPGTTSDGSATGGATTSGGGAATGGGSATGGARAGTTATGAGGTAVAAGDTSHCVGDRQYDPALYYYAPKCTPKFTGNNGGDTYMGVSPSTIKIIKYEGRPNPAVDAILDRLGANPSDEDVRRVFTAAAKWINARYELYGRKLEFKQIVGDCSAVPPDYVCLRNEMRSIVQREKPFAVFWITTLASPAFDELSAQKVINIGGDHFRDIFSQQRRPYHWDPQMGATQLTRIVGEWWCRRMHGGGQAKARYAGKTGTGEGQNPPTNDIRSKVRVLGVISQDDPENKLAINDLKTELAKCGAKVSHEYYYAQDIARAEEQRRLGVARMREDPESTSVMCFCDAVAPVFLYRTAEEQRWYPEHIMVGTNLMDTDYAAQQYDGTLNPGGRQYDNAFGVSTQAQAKPFGQDTAAMMLKEAGDTQPLPTSYRAAERDVQYYLMLAAMIQGAGPTLNPANLEKGAFAMGTRGGAANGVVDLFLNGRGFKAGDYTWIDDVREVYFSKARKSPYDDVNGTWVDIHNGRRFLAGQIPQGELVIPDSPR